MLRGTLCGTHTIQDVTLSMSTAAGVTNKWKCTLFVVCSGRPDHMHSFHCFQLFGVISKDCCVETMALIKNLKQLVLCEDE